MCFSLLFGNKRFSIAIPENLVEPLFTWKWDAFRSEKTGRQFHMRIDFEEKDQIIWENKHICYSVREGFFQTEILQDGDTWIWVFFRTVSREIIFRCTITADWTIGHLEVLKDHSYRNYVFEYLGKIFSCGVSQYKGMVIHGVLMEYQGKGIIITAPSETGKTTHARMWRDFENSIILNGDLSLCSRYDGKWMGVGMPWSGTSGECVNRMVPISAIVFLERGKVNQATKITGLDAFAKLSQNIKGPVWNSQEMNCVYDMADDFLQKIPAFHLKCCPNQEAVEVLKSLLLKDGIII